MKMRFSKDMTFPASWKEQLKKDKETLLQIRSGRRVLKQSSLGKGDFPNVSVKDPEGNPSTLSFSTLLVSLTNNMATF
tara:strand:- start:301 stop:534 length:234 start_codon:yes stop_codon:yes gene_type:complete